MHKEINPKIKENVTVVIPAYNEERNIAKIIEGARPYCSRIIVSVARKTTDRTADIARRLGAEIIFDHGLGKGDGMRTSIDYLENDGGIVVFIDSDGSHIPADIPTIVQPIINNKADMVIGSRFLGGSEELHGDFDKFLRMFFSMCITQIMNWRFKTKLQDTQNGYRALRISTLKNLHLTSNHFVIETEMDLKCLKKGYRILEEPSKELKREFGKSGISLSRDAWKMFFIYGWTILKHM